MTLIPLTLPPGVYRNGTEFQASNRWRDASLVRWTEGTMRPVGGWQTRLDMTAPVPRAALAWQDLGGDRWLASASHSALMVATASNLLYDITPADLAAGVATGSVNAGFGGGYFGLDFFGTTRAQPGAYSEATTWSLDTWGQNLVACSTSDGRLLEWDLNTAGDAVPIANAPVDNFGLVVTEERFLFALGANGNPRNVAWSDREDNTVWAPLTTNEAGDINLQTAGQIMCGLRTRGQTLILTDQDAHAATYQGPPFVYGIQRVGSSCGVVSRKAAATVDAGVFWMGQRGFYAYQGGAVTELPCEVSDFVFADINQSQMSKAVAVSNQQFSEIWWFYPSGSSLENDHYVVFNYKENHWAVGQLSRTTGVDRGVFSTPIWFDAAGVAISHETGLNYDGGDVYAESGPISLANGDNVMHATKLIPDELTQGDVTATFKTRFHPNDTEASHGPYAMSNPTSVRFTGRQIRMRVDGARLADWRVGIMRLDVTPGGKR